MSLLRLPLVLVASLLTAAPVLAGDEQDCFQGREPAIRIKGCSEVIQRAPNDAAGYHNRAVAYGLAGDLDNAIADYTKVIEMAPDNASAYENRGRAYASKGDNSRAAADQAKARDLMAKATAEPLAVTPKTPKGSTGAPKAAKAPPKAKVATKTNINPPQQTTPATGGSGFWSWLTGQSGAGQAGTGQAGASQGVTGQAGPKNTKP
jgi:tetratricopeptide (TPR) repeat protein